VSIHASDMRDDSASRGPRPILAIECSTPEASVAVRAADGGIVERAVPTGDRSRDHLPPAVDLLIEASQLDRRDLGGVAVSEGPGGFTGLRVSVAFAKGVAEALGIPALGVPSAVVASASTLADEDRRPTLVVMATKRGTAWVESIEADPDTGRRVSRGGQLVDPTTAGELRDDRRSVLADARQDPEIVASLCAEGVSAQRPRFSAAALLRLAERTPAIEWGDPTDLTVRYPRAPEAVILWQARHADR